MARQLRARKDGKAVTAPGFVARAVYDAEPALSGPAVTARSRKAKAAASSSQVNAAAPGRVRKNTTTKKRAVRARAAAAAANAPAPAPPEPVNPFLVITARNTQVAIQALQAVSGPVPRSPTESRDVSRGRRRDRDDRIDRRRNRSRSPQRDDDSSPGYRVRDYDLRRSQEFELPPPDRSAEYDRKWAGNLGGGTPLPEIHARLMHKLGAWHSAHEPDESNADQDCSVCAAMPSISTPLPCGCPWCASCITTSMIRFLVDRIEPGKCCSTIPQSMARPYMKECLFSDSPDPDSSQLKLENMLKRLARQSLTNDQLRCYACKAWIEDGSGARLTDVVTCPFSDWNERTCIICRDRAHYNGICPHATQLEDLGPDVKRCPGCHTAIYKRDGCDKVTCTVCQYTMCFPCGKLQATCGQACFEGSEDIEMKDVAECSHKGHWKWTTDGATISKNDDRKRCIKCHHEYLWYKECRQCGLFGVCGGCAQSMERDG